MEERKRDRRRMDAGYLLSFSYNKTKDPGVEKINIGDKTYMSG